MIKMRGCRNTWIASLITMSCVWQCWALELGAPFRDNAILQRDMNIPVWGWSAPGDTVTVEFAGQSKQAEAGTDGKWIVMLDPLKASFAPMELSVQVSGVRREPSTLNVEHSTMVVVTNIFVGEVWMASGQSNMEQPARETDVGKVLIKQILERVKEGKEKMPVIREARVTGDRTDLSFSGFRTSPYPLERAPASWTDGSDFSAYSSIAFAFACDLFRELNVPIGILNCSVGATSLESWIPPAALTRATNDYEAALRTRVQAIYPGTPENRDAWAKYYKDMEQWIAQSRKRLERYIPPEEPPACPGDLDETRNGIGWMYNAMMHPMAPYAISGVIWNQGYNNRNDGLNYYDGLMCMIPEWRKAWGRPDLPVYLHSWFAWKGGDSVPNLGATDEMRLSVWLAARDLPHTRMASMTDITGALHYDAKTVPGQRLARLALKYQYPSTKLRAGGLAGEILADSPTFKSYRVDGSKVIVSFDYAEGGLVVGQNSARAGAFSMPELLARADYKVQMFWLADKDCVWHRAAMRIDGEDVVVTSPEVSEPRGVAYGALAGELPNLYNKALLPATPFICYEHKLLTSRTCPGGRLKIAGNESDDKDHSEWSDEYSRMSLLGSQFRDNAVIQADQDTTFWGDAPGGSVVKLGFAGTEKEFFVPVGDRGWAITVAARPASAEPLTLKVSCRIDGNLVGEASVTNIVVGDVWFVATAPFGNSKNDKKSKKPPAGKAAVSMPDVRLFTPLTRKRINTTPKRYRLEASPTPDSQFYSKWCNIGELLSQSEQTVFACQLAMKIREQTGKPVGVVLMDSKTADVPMKSWIGGPWLKGVSSLSADYEALKYQYPIDDAYFAACEESLRKWKQYWGNFGETVPGFVLAEKRLPVGKDPFDFPVVSRYPRGETEAAQTYNMMICTFGPANFKGIVCLTPKVFCESNNGAYFASELSAMANSWKDTFSSHKDPYFFYLLPTQDLVPAISEPLGIHGKSHGVTMQSWPDAVDMGRDGFEKSLASLMNSILDEVYASSEKSEE